MPGPRLIDLSHPLYDGMPAYPGLPSAQVRPLLTHEESRNHYGGQAEFCLTEVAFASNTGTYLDSPWHRFPDQPDIAAIPLERVTSLPGVIVEATLTDHGADIADLGSKAAGAAVLLRTGWDAHWATDRYWNGGPFLSEESVARLVEAGPSLVGVDCANVDDTTDPARPAHTRLLDAGIVIIEHLTNLANLPTTGFRFHCAPLAVRGAASIPVRPYAELTAAAAPVPLVSLRAG